MLDSGSEETIGEGGGGEGSGGEGGGGESGGEEGGGGKGGDPRCRRSNRRKRS